MSERKLNIYYNNELLGYLTEKHGKYYSFEYIVDAKYDISLSMIRGNEPFDRNVVKAYFENLLPEGDILELISKAHLVSKNNPFSLLNVIGEDCAGAITLSKLTNELVDTLHSFTNKDLSKFIINSKKGLPYYEKGMRLSLAGVQNKTTVFIDKTNNYFLPSYTYPSTHIIKFENSHNENILLNELFCTKLAETLNIETSKMKLESFDSNEFLLIQRFDRIETNDKIRRIHMEDFAQISGTLSSNKYETEGGPSFKKIVSYIKDYNKYPIKDIISLAKILVFNLLIGNNDYHSKNLSVLHEPYYKLSPFYDLLSTAIYHELSTDMAMKVNNEVNSKSVTRLDIELELDSWGLKGKMILEEIKNDFKHILKNAKELLNTRPFNQNKDFLKNIMFLIEKNVLLYLI